MSMKSEQLAQSIQATQKFTEAKAQEILGFEDIINELTFIAASLKTGKLTIQIFSNLPILTQAFQIYLDKCQNIDLYYQYKISKLPDLSQTFNTVPKVDWVANSAECLGLERMLQAESVTIPWTSLPSSVEGKGCMLSIKDKLASLIF